MINERSRALIPLVLLVVFAFGAVSCERERREFKGTPRQGVTLGVPATNLRAGPHTPALPAVGPYSENAYAQSQGQRLFSQYNCTGCHAQGGGGQGPALMDSAWIYGGAPDQIYASIVEGRPNGMPSFRGRLTNDQTWQLVAYIQSLGGIGRRDVRSGRTDHMQVRSSPQNTKAADSSHVAPTARDTSGSR